MIQSKCVKMFYKLGIVIIALREKVLCGKVRKMFIYNFFFNKERMYLLHVQSPEFVPLLPLKFVGNKGQHCFANQCPSPI